MKWLRVLLMPLYRVWFYILLAIPIFAMFPFLVLATLSEKTYGAFFKMAQIWAGFIVIGMGWWPMITRKANMQQKQSYMLVANHSSMADIMLMLLIAKNPFVFVGKAELAKIPIFGFFYKRTCILVNRGNARSRKAVFDSASRRINDGVGICIFPEGGVPEDRSIVLDDFKDGAFRLAIEHQIPIVPISFYDNKKRFPFSFFYGSPGKMRAKTHPILPTDGLEVQKDKASLREHIRSIILEDLTANS